MTESQPVPGPGSPKAHALYHATCASSLLAQADSVASGSLIAHAQYAQAHALASLAWSAIAPPARERIERPAQPAPRRQEGVTRYDG